MIKIGIIPCQNGLGHISRSIDLANKLSSRYSIFFISNLKKNKKFSINKSVKKIQFINDFHSKEKKYNQSWYKKLESKIKSLNIDILISDNLPEIIFLKYKSIIISNFFWHEIFNIKNKKLEKTLEILKFKKIKIFRNKIFKDQKNFSKIGFIGSINKKKKLDDGLLISFGSDDLMSNNILEEIEKIIYDKTRKTTLHLDPKYYKKKYIKFNVVMATYSDEMFDKIKYAIIKPGFGLIKDCLKNKVLIFSYLNSNFNQEFFNNANALKKNNLGFITKSLIKSYKTTEIGKVSETNNKKDHFFNGEADIVEYIESIV